MNEQLPTTPGFEQTCQRIKTILAEVRQNAYRAINVAMVTAYWEIGRITVEQEQQGQERAEYGKGLLVELSQRLTAEFGRGDDRYNLGEMRAFYLTYPIWDAVRPELSWTHYRLLLRAENPDARRFYENEAINARWSTRELERQIHSLLFERLALSRDREGVLALTKRATKSNNPPTSSKIPTSWNSPACPRANDTLNRTWSRL
ncbi:MAG: hypothetical protein JXB10_03605 [Pirellulales bacterium]|nr:hypothetical protein [Pirellulales bacterium]